MLVKAPTPTCFICSCVFLTPPNQEGGKQTLDFNRLTSSTPVLFQREMAAKSLSKLNNSITTMQNTHTTLLKPGHFRGEEFIDFKLLPLGPSPLISGKKKNKGGGTHHDSPSVGRGRANVNPHTNADCSSLEGFYSAVWFLLTSNGLFYNRAHLWTKCVTQ